MKDRVPRYPGRVTLTPVEGQANTYDMVRADEPTEAGTPLNTASLLSAATSQNIFGDNSNLHTPDEAFRALISFISTGTTKTDVIETSQTWEAPADLVGNSVYVICVGGGGGGGGASNVYSDSGYYTTGGSSGGGGGSGYVSFGKVDVLPSGEYDVIIGAGGTDGANGSYYSGSWSGKNGTDGGATSFANIVVAQGGKGGQGAINTSTSVHQARGGNGGNGNAGGGGGGSASFSASYPAGNGGDGYYGGGGGGGTGGDYGSGKGGNSVYGGGGGGYAGHGTSGPSIGPVPHKTVCKILDGLLDTSNWQGNASDAEINNRAAGIRNYPEKHAYEGIGGGAGAFGVTSLASYACWPGGGGFFANGENGSGAPDSGYGLGGAGGGGMFSSYKVIESTTVGAMHGYGEGRNGKASSNGMSSGGKGGRGFGVREDSAYFHATGTTQYDGVCIIYYHTKNFMDSLMP